MSKQNKFILVLLINIAVLGLYFCMNFYDYINIEFNYTEKKALINIYFFGALIGILITLYFSLLILAKQYKFIKSNRVLVFSLLVLVILVYVREDKINNIRKYISKNGGIVEHAIVYNKRGSREYSLAVDVEYKTYKKSIRCERDVYSRININDTVLILHSRKFPKMSVIYNFFPETQTIQQCKDGCYYLNGKIVDSLDVQ